MTASSIQISSVKFYGLRKKRHTQNIGHSLQLTCKRLKEEQMPDPYHARILGPSGRWQIFYRQQEALQFVRDKQEDLHVFAFETRSAEKQTGQRQFLVTTYHVFWHYYTQLKRNQRHHYEIIPEGSPCKLYFDLEFNKSCNTGLDGVTMIDSLIKYVCCWLRELYNAQCSRQEILELDASTDTKFSRHLIFQSENVVFRDNIHAGRFIQSIFLALKNALLDRDCVIGHSVSHSETETPLLVSGTRSSSDAANTENNHREQTENTNYCLYPSTPDENNYNRDVHNASFITDSSSASDEMIVSGEKKCEQVFKQEEDDLFLNASCGHETMGFEFEEDGFCYESLDVSKVTHSCLNTVGLSLNEQPETLSFSPKAHDKCQIKHNLGTSSLVEKHDTLVSFHNSLPTCFQATSATSQRMTSSPSPKGLPDGFDLLEVGEEITSETVHKLSHRVFQQHMPEQLQRQLFVKAHDGQDTCFVDLGVYTKNRNFRLYKSCKLGKTAPFELAETNTFTVDSKLQAKEIFLEKTAPYELAETNTFTFDSKLEAKEIFHAKTAPFELAETNTFTVDSKLEAKEIFLASLISNISVPYERTLTFGGTCSSENKNQRTKQTDNMQLCDERKEGSGHSPYPEVDDFITEQVSDNGKSGYIRRWTYFPKAEILSYDILGDRFCCRIQRQHRKNNIRLIVNLQKGIWYQKCYDPDCQAVNFKSEEFQLPCHVLPSSYFADDFEELVDLDGDEACLEALQCAEQLMPAGEGTPSSCSSDCLYSH